MCKKTLHETNRGNLCLMRSLRLSRISISHEILQFSLMQFDINHNNFAYSWHTQTRTLLYICQLVSPEMHKLREKIMKH